MRILHTSDWHLGRSFHREGMLTHQADFVDHLIAAVEEHEVDLVVVSGDIFDRALPPVDAVALADETFVRLAHSRARVVITSGNHDSAQRLGFSSQLIDAAGVHLRTDASGLATPVVIDDEHGAVAVYGIPFLDPHAVAGPWGLGKPSHESALDEAAQRIRADLGTRRHTRSVVMAHAFVAGAQPSDSERDISVGGVQRVPTSTFDDFDYVALGHLHGAHTLTDSIRYSGSPLAYSFSEAAHTKGSWLVDLDGDGVARADFLPSPVPRPLARLRGTLDELLGDPSLTAHEASWVEATLTDALRPELPMERLQQRFPHAVLLNHERSGDLNGSRHVSAATQRSDLELTLDFVDDVRGVPASPDELALLTEAVETCCSPSADTVVSEAG